MYEAFMLGRKTQFDGRYLAISRVGIQNLAISRVGVQNLAISRVGIQNALSVKQCYTQNDQNSLLARVAV